MTVFTATNETLCPDSVKFFHILNESYTIAILGDAGYNYYGNEYGDLRKKKIIAGIRDDVSGNQNRIGYAKAGCEEMKHKASVFTAHIVLCGKVYRTAKNKV